MNPNGNRERNRRNGNGPDEDDDVNPFAVAAGVAAGVAALAGGIYWLTRGSQLEEPSQQKKIAPQAQGTIVRARPVTPPSSSEDEQTGSVSGYLADLLSRIAAPSSESSASYEPESYRRVPPPSSPVLSNLSALLSDIYVRYLQIRQDDFELHYRVFNGVFKHLHQKMKEVDLYYRKYSSTVQFAGSHYDNLRIKKPDEFDMDIVIDLPLNLKAHPTNPAESDIVIEAMKAGFVQLRMGKQFQNLPMRDGQEWQNNKAAYEWMDDSNYLQRSKFLDWFKSVVNRALNKFEVGSWPALPIYYVDGVPYAIRKSESGPAITLIIENKSRGFKLDVDLVPALKFPESRWPVGPAYRRIPAHCARGDWLVVGKPLKGGVPHDRARSWRLALHNQEGELMHGAGNMKQALRLIKKLRDSLGMKEIASYYIKTLFFWEIIEKDDLNFWHKNNPAFLFKHMVGKLHAALVNKKIPYFWNKGNNLVGGVDERLLFQYAAKLVPLMQVLQAPHEYKQVARYLLTDDEYRDYSARFLHKL